MDDMSLLLSRLTNTASLYIKRVAELRREASHLNQMPVFFGRYIYKDEHYLVLVPRMVNGERKLRYVGRDPIKITEALEELKRGDRLTAIEQELEALESASNMFMRQLRQADYALSLEDS